MKIFSASLVALLIIFQSIGFAAVETFSASSEYLMSDYDTPEIAEEIALDFAKQNAAEQAGIYLETYSRTKDFEIDVSEINTVASFKVKVLTKNIMRQPQQGGRVLLRADITATVDTSELDNFLAQKHEQRQAAIQRYKELQKMNAEIKHDIDALQVKLAAVKDDVKDDDLLVEQERINREFLSNQKLKDFGQKLGARKEFKYDMSLIDEAIKINPKNLRAYFNQALYTPPILIPNLDAINKASAIAPNEAAIYIMRGTHHSNTGLLKRLKDKNADVKQIFDKALENYNKAVELDPNNALTYLNRGLFYKSIEDYDKAFADYSKAVELDPNNLLARERRAELYEKLKNNPAAGGDYEKIIEGTDTKNLDGFGYLNLGEKYEKLKDYTHALECYTKAIEMKPKFEFADHRVAAYDSRAKVYMRLGEYDKAIADFDKGLELNKNSKRSTSGLMDFSIEFKKRSATSLRDCTKAIAEDPNNQDAYYRRSVDLFSIGKHEAALEDLNTLIKLNPNYGNGKAYFSRAVVYEELGRNEEAIADYKKRLELDPNANTAKENLLRLTNPDLYKESEALLKQADSLRDNKNYTDAVDAYSKVLELDPENQDALFNRGLMHIYTNEYYLALADYENLLELNPDYDQAAYNNRGICYTNTERYKEALADFNKALELAPNNAVTYNNRAWAYEQLGDLKKALADYDKAIELDPNNETAKTNRQRVLDKMKK